MTRKSAIIYLAVQLSLRILKEYKMNDFNNQYDFNNFFMNMSYNMQLNEARKKEGKALLKSASILGALLILYDILIKVFGYVFYFVFVSIKTSGLTLSWTKVTDYFKANSWLDSSSAFAMAYSSFVVIASFTVILLISRFVFGIKLSHILRYKKGYARTAMISFPAVMLLNLLLSFIITVITLVLSENGITVPEADFSISEVSVKAFFFQLLYSVIVAPIVEETLYRGIALHLLKPYGKGMAVIVSSLIFGLMHGNISQAASAFAVALVMGTITVQCGSIIPTIIIHLLNNLIATMPDFSNALGSDLIYNIYIGIVILCLVLGTLVIFAYHKKITLPKDEGCVLELSTRYMYAMLNIPMILYWCTIIYTFVSSFKKAN